MSASFRRDLRDDVLAIEGIADAEVGEREGRTVVRVWLDGTRRPAEVAARIRALLTATPGDGSAEPADVHRHAAAPQPRRTGLGRGLDALIPPPADRLSRPKQQLTPLRDADGPIQLDVVAVVERADGIAVRAEDTVGRSAEVWAEDRDTEAAVVAAVAGILGVAVPRLVSVDVHEAGGESVVTVVLETHEGSRRVGSAIARAGMPFTVGRAVWAALHHGDGATG